MGSTQSLLTICVRIDSFQPVGIHIIKKYPIKFLWLKLKPTKKVLQGKQTKQAIIEAASRCFAEKGYAACSMDNIAQAAGLSKGGLYAHFKSKEELFTTVIKQEHDRAIQRAQSVLDNPPYLDGLIWYMGECIRNAGFPMDHRLWTEVLAVAGRDPAMKALFLKSERRSRNFTKELLRRGDAKP